MPPYPDKEAKGSSSSCEYIPVLARAPANPNQNPQVRSNPKVEPSPQAAVQAALTLAAPYFSGDSDSDDHFLPLPAASLMQPQPLNNMQPPSGPSSVAQDAQKLSKGDPTAPGQPADAFLIPQKSEDIHSKAGSSASPENTPPNGSADPKRTDTAPSDNAKRVTKTEDVDAETTSQSPDCVAPQISKEGSPSDAVEPANSNGDSVVVSKNCLDEVLQQLSNRISELEHIRERKRARVESLSSAAFLAQSPAMALWPQTAAAAQHALGAQPPGLVPAAGLALLPGSLAPGVAPSRSGTSFLPGAPDAPGALQGLAGQVAPPPPPPPPPPPQDGADRKQSRYWTADEHQRFLAAIKTCGPKNYVQIAEIVGTRNAKQVRTHAQKFQKKLEREEAKRREDLQRHGAHPAGTAVSAAAVAAVAAAAAAMHRGAAATHHLNADASAHRAFAPPLLLPFQGAAIDASHAPFTGPFPVAQARAVNSADGSSSTNNTSHQHQGDFADALAGPCAQSAAIAAVAAEAAALGGRVANAQMPVVAHSEGKSVKAGPAGAKAASVGTGKSVGKNAGAVKAVAEIAPATNGRNHTAMTESQNRGAQALANAKCAKGRSSVASGEVVESVSKGGEVSKNSNSAPSQASAGTDKVDTAKRGGTQGADVNDPSQPIDHDQVSRFRSCDELSGICDAVKQDLLNSQSNEANTMVTTDGDAVMKDSCAQMPNSGGQGQGVTGKLAEVDDGVGKTPGA